MFNYVSNRASVHHLNFFHNMPSPLNIAVNNQLLFKNIFSNQITAYHPFQTGIHQVEMIQGEKSHSILLPLTAHEYYTVFIIDNFHCFLVPNDNQLHKNESNIRFVNISPTFSPIDIAVTGGDVLFHNVLFQTATDFLPITPMTIDLEIRLSGTKQVLMTLPKITCNPNHSQTIIITSSSYQNIASSMKDGNVLLNPS